MNQFLKGPTPALIQKTVHRSEEHYLETEVERSFSKPQAEALHDHLRWIMRRLIWCFTRIGAPGGGYGSVWFDVSTSGLQGGDAIPVPLRPCCPFPKNRIQSWH